MNKNISQKSRFAARQITVVGVLSAICAVLGISGIGFIQLPIIGATVMHIPVIIGAILEGPIVGMILGLMFGIFSIIQNLVRPSILSFALANPLVSVVPRILIGLLAYYTYRALKFVKVKSVRIGAAAVVGSMVNTIGVLGMIFVLYAGRYAQIRNIKTDMVSSALLAIAGSNGVAEAIVAVVLTVPIVVAVEKIRKNR